MTPYWNIDGLPDGYIHSGSTVDGFINAVTMGEGPHYPWGKPWGNGWTACFIELDYYQLRPYLTKKAVTCPQCIAHEKSTEEKDLCSDTMTPSTLLTRGIHFNAGDTEENPSCQQKSTSENEPLKAARSGE